MHLRGYARSVGVNIHEIHSCVKTLTGLLNKLHGIGLCHGDLSASNVIITRYNQVSWALFSILGETWKQYDRLQAPKIHLF